MPRNEAAEAVSLRLSVTNRCQLRCSYCAPAGRPPGPPAEPLMIPEILRLVRFLRDRFGLRKVHLTGGEPLLRPDLPEVIACLTAEHVPDLALTTNGQQLAELAPVLRAAGLPRINISLDSLDADTYGRLTGGGRLDRTLAGILAARQAGFSPVKLNMVVLRGVNDSEVHQIVRWGLQHGCQVRLLELMPIGPGRACFAERFISSGEVRERLADHFSLTYMGRPAGDSSRNWLLRDARGFQGTVGFISPCSDAFCAGCRRLRLTADGRLLGCLARAGGQDIRRLLADDHRTDAALARAIGLALAWKRRGRQFAAVRPMMAVGG